MGLGALRGASVGLWFLLAVACSSESTETDADGESSASDGGTSGDGDQKEVGGTDGGGGTATGGNAPVVTPGEVLDPQDLRADAPGCASFDYRCNNTCFESGEESTECTSLHLMTPTLAHGWAFAPDGALYLSVTAAPGLAPLHRLSPETMQAEGVSGSEALRLEADNDSYASRLLRTDDTHIYLINRRLVDGAYEYLVQRMPLAGGSPETLISGLSGVPGGMVLAGGKVFVEDGDHNLHVVELDGSNYQATEIRASRLAANGGDVYLASGNSAIGYDIMKIPGGDVDAFEELFHTTTYIQRLFSQAGQLYWLSDEAFGAVTETELVEIMQTPGEHEFANVGDGRLLFAMPNGEIISQRLDYGESELLAVVNSPDLATSNDDYLFVVGYRTTIMRFDL